MRLLIFIGLVVLFSIQSLSSQVEIDYYSTPNNIDLFHVTMIGDMPYFTANFHNASPPRNETEIWSFDDLRLRKELTISAVNDSLNHLFLFDFWAEGEEAFLFGYCSHITSRENYVYFSKVDMTSDEIYDLELIPFNFYRNLLGSYQVLLNDKREWFLMEVDKVSLASKSLFKFSLERGEMIWAKFEIPNDLEISLLREAYFDFHNELLFVTAFNTQRHFVVFDLDFNYQYSHKPFSLFNGINHTFTETLIIGDNGKNYPIFERVRNQNQTVIHQRNMSISGNQISISEDYQPFNVNDDIYLLKKYQKDDFTMVHYSKSSINSFNEDYGFDICYFSPEGELIKKYSIEENEPMGIDFLLINEETGVGYGSGWRTTLGNFENFIFKIDLNDTISSTDEVEEEEPLRILKTNLVTDGSLRIHEGEFQLNQLAVYDVIGRKVIGQVNEYESDISFLPAGQYLLRYQSGHRMITERFVKVD